MTTFYRPAMLAILLTAGGLPALADDAGDIDAAQKFATPILGQCRFSHHGAGNLADVNRVFHLKYRLPGQGQDEPDNRLTLVQLLCSADADNFSSVYVSRNPDGDGWALLTFAEPKLAYDYTDEYFSQLKTPPKIVAYVTRAALANSIYDAAAMKISMHLKWRSRDDAWSSGVWQFIDGEFALKQYSVDPTYDLDTSEANESTPPQPKSYQVYPQPLLKSD
jgi:hypothetical protein